MRWGFQEVSIGGKSINGTYCHPFFRRGEWELCCKMKCQKSDPQSSFIASRSKTSSRSPRLKEKIGRSHSLPSFTMTGESQEHHVSNNATQHQKKALRKHQSFQEDQGLDTTLHLQSLPHYQPKMKTTSPLSQENIEGITNVVMGAAFEVLHREEKNTSIAALSYPHAPFHGATLDLLHREITNTPALSLIYPHTPINGEELDRMTETFLNRRIMGRRSSMLGDSLSAQAHSLLNAANNIEGLRQEMSRRHSTFL
eukprot:4433166-Ditylum_brightwellii.AAC.1